MVGILMTIIPMITYRIDSIQGSDEWEQSDAELSTSSLIAEDRDVISLLDNTADL